MRPFVADAPIAVVVQHLTKPLPSILEKVPDCPPAIVKLINHMTAKDPTKRSATYEQLLAELRAAEESLTEAAPKPCVALCSALPCRSSWPAPGLLKVNCNLRHLRQLLPRGLRRLPGLWRLARNPTHLSARRNSPWKSPRCPLRKRSSASLKRSKKRNPSFDPSSATSTIDDGAVVDLSLDVSAVTDIIPVGVLTSAPASAPQRSSQKSAQRPGPAAGFASSRSSNVEKHPSAISARCVICR